MYSLIRQSVLSLVIIFLSIGSAYAQIEKWEWIKTFGGKNADEIYSSCCDKAGNVYVAGYFQGEIDLDGKELISNGDTDALIAKFDKSGNLCWAKQVGGDFSENLIITEYAKKIKVDYEGNIIVAGIFAWDATIDNITLKSAGNNDIFVIKYSPDGLLLWAKSFGSFNHDNLFDMDIDHKGGIYISGIINGPLQSNGSIIQETENLKGSTTYIAKFEPQGNLLWLRADQGVSNNTFISIDKNNFIYYGINYSSAMTINGKVLESEGKGDFIIQQLNTSGETIWQKKFSSIYNDVLGSLNISLDNRLLISGKYANISELKLKSSLDTIDDSRTYFSSIYPDGSLSWSVNNSGPSFPKGTSLVESVDGHYLSSDIYLTEVNIDGRILTPTDNWFNSYLASHNSEGSISNILLQLPGIITSVITDSHESIIVTGTSSNSIGISGAYNSTGGFIDFFIGKLSCPLADELSVKDGGSAEIMEYNIFPNPTSNKYCTIESRTVTIVDGINITNQDGKLLQYDTDCSLPYKLDLFYLSKGTYFVSIIKGSITVTRQVVIN
jgi:hypothetical protein